MTFKHENSVAQAKFCRCFGLILMHKLTAVVTAVVGDDR